MASIVVSGDTSGAVTITAPAIAGTTTLTLPTTSGTIVTTAGATTVEFAAGSAASPSITFTGDTNTGIFSPTADTIAFSEGGTEAMRIDSAGDVGIGSTNPTRKLQISQSIATTYTGDFDDAPNQLYIVNTNTTTNAYTGLQMDVGSNSQCAISAIRTGDGEVAMAFGTRVAGVRAERMRIDSSGNVGIGITSPGSLGLSVAKSSGTATGLQLYQTTTEVFRLTTNNTTVDVRGRTALPLVFFTDDTERMRITSGGDVLVGNTTTINGGKLYSQSSTTPAEFYSTGAAGNAGMFVEKSVNDSTTSNVFVRFFINNGSAGSGQINANGASSAAFGTYSDERLKQNIEDLPSQLENIKSLRPVEFDYKAGGHQIGFVAQEMQEIYPDTVGMGEDGMLTITGWDKTTARLVKAIQELNAKVEAQAAEIQALKGAR